MLKIYTHSDKYKAKDKKALTLLAVAVVLVNLQKMSAFNSQQRRSANLCNSGWPDKNKNKNLQSNSYHKRAKLSTKVAKLLEMVAPLPKHYFFTWNQSLKPT